MMMVLLSIFTFITLMLVFILVQFHRFTSQYRPIHNEIMATLKSIKKPKRITREAAIQNARNRKRSSKHFSGLTNIDPKKYFAPAQHEDEIHQRLRERGVNPDDVDIPPEIEEIDEEGLLIPPDHTDGNNEGFFQRNRE